MRRYPRWIITPGLGVWLAMGAIVAARAQSPVTFQVDMSAQIANLSFNPAGGDRVQARGSFQGWTGGFWLTNSPANTNIFSGTYLIADPSGTAEQYKFVIIVNGDGTNSWNNAEQLDLPGGNRSFTFTIAGGAQSLPVVYYSNQLPAGAVPTHPITFRVDMSVQMTNGNFNPGTADTVEVRGDFELTPWAGGGVLTNSPGNLKVYSGVFQDANHSGAQLAYKFVIVPNGGGANYESLNNNRVLVEPNTNGVALPVVYFSNQGPPNPIVFQVDMSVQIAEGFFSPNSDFVEARGDFNGWNGGFQLTNNPIAPNTNLYTGAYGVSDPPGTAEQYKFVVNGGNYERPFSPTNDNRSFTLAGGSQTLPKVYFSDLGPSDVLATDTSVTFSVNMTNAVGTDAVQFNPGVNNVYINGDFLPWWGWGSFPSQYQLVRNGTSKIYSLTLLIPKGNPVELTYKYGIDSADDEAGFKINHIRYLRATNNYVMPLDTFGTQYAEPSFGNLNAGHQSAGHVLISWLGRPGVQLQTATNLPNPVWQSHPETDSLSLTNWPAATGRLFFRLIKQP